MSFLDLGLSPELLHAIEDAGYVTPTPIQAQAIPPALTGRDVLGCAQTGTGKTAAFTVPMIEALSAGRAKARMPRSLILTPTRELATQIAENFEIYGKYHKLSMALLIGGVSMDAQVRKLDRGVDVLIATPGRLLDHFERGRILMSDIKILVIDEADRMLDMGFIPDVERIVKNLSKIRQTLFFSATMPKEIRRLADAFLMNPKEISVAPPASPAETVAQHLTVVGARDKRDALRKLINNEDVRNALVFCNRKRDVDRLFKSLKKHGFNAAALHGDMDQMSRTKTLGAFKDNEITILVASDVAARGLDINDLSHVFNFDVPIHAEDYVHRIGRTGRAGKDGKAFTLATPEDGVFVSAIVKLIGKEIPAHEIDGMGPVSLDDAPDKKRGRSRRTPAKKTASARPAKKVDAKPKEEKLPAKDVVAKDRDLKDVDAKEIEAKKSRPPRQRKTRDRANGGSAIDNNSNKPVIGMGDHVPAFMRRPARATDGQRKA
ncbi:MAG: DEAD/DEAH box helicase [Pseudomonadota bacterium]|nr:DEAD/DEAH box helicase [Pseudomonadota bacterium]